MRTLLWAFVFAAVSAFAYLAIGYVVAARLSGPVREPADRTPADAGLAFRTVVFETDDGLLLEGWWVEDPGAARTAVLVHGWGGGKYNAHVVETARVYAGAGFDVLMLDLRAHGGSEGERVTLGYREVRDVRVALAWLEGRGIAPDEVVLHGWSMGGATVLRAAPDTGVAAVVAESAYADLPPLLGERLPEASGLPAFLNPGIFFMGRRFLGIDAWAVRPEEDARRLYEEEVPCMIIHSRADALVPFEHAEALAKAHPEATFWRLEDYDHVRAYTHPDYRERLLRFLDGTAASAPDGRRRDAV
ncbi:MAG TPA: alpha/beta fold hydrolase [Rubrobacteraceae bacterium]|nr:alpha/beta fold hydrolase [Rubrobacteraceae bacterium]